MTDFAVPATCSGLRWDRTATSCDIPTLYHLTRIAKCKRITSGEDFNVERADFFNLQPYSNLTAPNSEKSSIDKDNNNRSH
jgi:hypothetical protein